MQILLVTLPHFSLIPFYKWRAGTEHTSGKPPATKPCRRRGSRGSEQQRDLTATSLGKRSMSLIKMQIPAQRRCTPALEGGISLERPSPTEAKSKSQPRCQRLCMAFDSSHMGPGPTWMCFCVQKSTLSTNQSSCSVLNASFEQRVRGDVKNTLP